MSGRRGLRGLSMVESVIAIFMLLAGFLVMARLFHAALRYQARVESQVVAVLLAERQLEQVRGWSQSVHGSAGSQLFTDWSGCPGTAVNVTDPLHPGFSVQVVTAPQTLMNPCSLFEQAFQTTGLEKKLTSSVRAVTVTVAWGASQHVLFSLLARPTGLPEGAGPVHPATVSPGTTTSLARDAFAPLNVVAKDSRGRPLDDLFYTWEIHPGVGNDGGGFGTLEGARDGRAMTICNRIYDLGIPAAPIPNAYGSGNCNAFATAKYRGMRIQGGSGQIQVQ